MAEQKLENISKDKSDSSQSKAENESKPKQKSVATTAKKQILQVLKQIKSLML